MPGIGSFVYAGAEQARLCRRPTRRAGPGDLRRVCQTPLVSYKWQEDFWEGPIAMRPESRGADVPKERFPAETQNRRFKALQARDASPDGRSAGAGE